MQELAESETASDKNEKLKNRFVSPNPNNYTCPLSRM